MYVGCSLMGFVFGIDDDEESDAQGSATPASSAGGLVFSPLV
jgi:hypothetical protein